MPKKFFTFLYRFNASKQQKSSLCPPFLLYCLESHHTSLAHEATGGPLTLLFQHQTGRYKPWPAPTEAKAAKVHNRPINLRRKK